MSDHADISDSADLHIARAENRARYGGERDAREYADDIGAEYCPECYALYYPQPEVAHKGHTCPAD